MSLLTTTTTTTILLPARTCVAPPHHNFHFLLCSHSCLCVDVQGPNFVEVVVCIKGCLKCGTEGATGDDWRETGFFVFGDKLAVHVSHLVAIRRAVQSGTSIADAWQDILVPLADDWEWMETSSFANKWAEVFRCLQGVFLFVVITSY